MGISGRARHPVRLTAMTAASVDAMRYEWRAGLPSGLGRALDPASDAEDVAQGADVDLPLWMVQNLAARQMVTLRCFSPMALRLVPLHLWPCGHPCHGLHMQSVSEQPRI